MDPSRTLFILFVVIFTAAAAIWDWRTKRLPNVLTVSAFALALVFHVAFGIASGGWPGAGRGLMFAVAGFATGFGILLVLWLIGGGGGGDVKLMGALGAWLGTAATLQVFLLSAVLVFLGAVGILGWNLSRRGLKRTNKRFKSPTSRRGRSTMAETAEQVARRRLMPYGVPVALATWCVLAYPRLKEMLLQG
jgi:prepilin peptidase CpaA